MSDMHDLNKAVFDRAKHVVPIKPFYFWMAEGDSTIIGGTISLYTDYEIALATCSPAINGNNNAIYGSFLNKPPNFSLVDRLPALKQAFDSCRTARVKGLYLSLGRNDLSLGVGNFAGNPAGFLTAMAATCDQIRSWGVKIVLRQPFFGVTSGTAYNADVTTYAAGIASWVGPFDPTFTSGKHVDAVVNLTGTGMAAPSDADNTAKFPDGVHPSNAGYALVAPAVIAAINAINLSVTG